MKGSSFRARLASRIQLGHFFSQFSFASRAIESERGITRSLELLLSCVLKFLVVNERKARETQG